LRRTAKNKTVFALLMVIIMPIIAVTVILPRLSLFTLLTGEGKIKANIYDVYFADYSEDPELDADRFTLEILLDFRNGNVDKKIVIPRIYLELEYLDKPVGKAWTTEELILEPFKNKDSKSAGLLSLYISLYVGKESGVSEFITGVLADKIGATGVDLTLYLGDMPLKIDILLGRVISLIMGNQSVTDLLDIDTITSILGDGGDGEDDSDKYLIPEDYLLLSNTSIVDFNENDIRTLLNIENRTVLGQVGDSLIFGAKDKITKIYWVNGSIGNSAVGDGNYSWQYWNSTDWEDFPAPSKPDFTFNETKEITIDSGALSGWSKHQITSFWDRDYYYIKCEVEDLDSAVNTTLEENSTYITMNVKESKLNNYKTPSSSGSPSSNGIEPQQFEDLIGGGDDDTVYPELDEFDIPLEKGLLKTDMEMEDYFLANGINFDDLLDDWVLPPFIRGLDTLGKTPNIYAIDEDYPPTDGGEGFDLDLDVILDKMIGFLVTHNLELGGFLLECQFDFTGLFEFLGENFEGLTAPDGIKIATGENIYAPVYETRRYQTTIIFSYITLIAMIIILGAIVPYLASKRVDQSMIFPDIKNLDKYVEKVKREMEIGISAEEIELLKTAAFKKKVSFLDSDKIKKGEGK